MYCPRCGRQPSSDALRFCSYCGFRLGVVKASLVDDGEASAMDHFTIKEISKERQRDINIGVILMFAGAMLATLLAGRTGFGLGREGGAVLLAIFFSSIVLLSRPIMKLIYKLLSWEEPPPHCFSMNQRRIVFGSILMFTSTILLAITSLLMFGRMRTPELFIGLVVAFVLLLIVSRHVRKALSYLVVGDDDVNVFLGTAVSHEPCSVVSAASGPALTAGHEVPVSLFTSQRVTTAEILSPASVTEQTTNLLENK